jgi:hypothetical protein
MLKKTYLILLGFLPCGIFAVLFIRPPRIQAAAPRPLSKSELLAVVPGEGQRENILGDIRSHGLLFTPSAESQALLSKAGVGTEGRKIGTISRPNGSFGGATVRHEQPYLVRDLTAEAQALRELGRTDEAGKIEQRTHTIQSAQANPN